MDKLRMRTANKADENFKKLAALFPEAVTETKDANGEVVRAIDKDVLMQEISCKVVDGKEERYQFTWPDKKKSVLLANAPTSKTLRPVRNDETVPTGADSDGKPYCSSGSVDFDTTENLYIEGDNLEVLKLLRETYLGKIKMIYIDPPYNTGGDFVYEDDFAQDIGEYLANSGQYDDNGNRMVQNTESNGRFHTDWLNMIYPRLKLARDLLTDNGAIFISIDGNEVHNLRKIADEIYGKDNFIAQIAWKRKKEISNDSKNVAIQGEYILCYGKQNTRLKLEPLSKAYIGKAYKEPNKAFPLGKWRPVPLTVSAGLSGGGYKYTITTPSGKKHTRIWAYPEKGYKKLLQENKIYFGKDEDGVPQRVMYLSESKGQPISNYWDNVATNKEGKKDILDIFGENAFDTPKPIDLIQKMMNVTLGVDDTILDFFSGSATTAHAAMQMNAEDGGHRKFIMVQMAERTDERSSAYKAGYKYISEIGKERIRRAGAKIKEDTGLAAQDLDVGFRVLKCDTSNMKDVYYSPENYDVMMFSQMEDNIKPDRTPEDLLFQVMLDLGVLLSSKIEETTIAGKKVLNVADNHLIACFDEDVTGETITIIAKQKPDYFVMRDNSMASDSVATNFDQIFATYSPKTIRKVL